MRLETIRTVCAELGISRATVYRLVEELNLQTYKRRGDRESYVDIDALQEARQFQPQRPTATPAEAASVVVPAAVPPHPPARTDDGRPLMVAAIIPHPDGDPALLMTGRVRAAQRVWSWVGGHVHQGEEPAAAVLRELTEELAVKDARVVRLLGTVDTHLDASPWWGNRFSGGYLSLNFLVTVGSSDVQVIDHEELSSAEWLPLDRVADALASLPDELSAPALRFAHDAIAQPATGASTEPLVIPADLKPLAAAIIVRDNRALLTERRFPGFGEQWSWPSGQIEHGETLEEAILRELREELLIEDAHVVKFLGDIDLPSGFRMSHFHVTIPDDAEPRLNDYEQLVRFAWMTRTETEKAFKSLHPSIASRALEFLDQVLASTKAQAKASVKKR